MPWGLSALKDTMANPAWTYSQLDSFETCPKKFYHTKVVRDFPEPPTVHTEWGTKVHTAFEEFVLHGVMLPEGMTQWQTLANNLAKLPGQKIAEQKFAIDKNFQPTDWKQAWSRGIADLVVINGKHAATLDYKTGRRKPTEQLELYACYIFHHYPEVEQVNTGFVWLKDRRIDTKKINRQEVPIVWQQFLPRVAKLESAYERDKWPARSSGLCNGWCPVTSCEFNRKKP